MSEPTAFRPNVLVIKKLGSKMLGAGVTLNQYVPGPRVTSKLFTWKVYSNCPGKDRPVGVMVTGEVPLAITVPPLPTETPVRMDQSADVTLAIVTARLFENRPCTVQVWPGETMKFS